MFIVAERSAGCWAVQQIADLAQDSYRLSDASLQLNSWNSMYTIKSIPTNRITVLLLERGRCDDRFEAKFENYPAPINSINYYGLQRGNALIRWREDFCVWVGKALNCTWGLNNCRKAMDNIEKKWSLNATSSTRNYCLFVNKSIRHSHWIETPRLRQLSRWFSRHFPIAMRHRCTWARI